MNNVTMSAPEQAIIAELRGFRELMEERTENLSNTLERVEQQTIRTNGRVTKLELINAESVGKAKITGGLWGMTTAIAISIVAFFVNQRVL